MYERFVYDVETCPMQFSVLITNMLEPSSDFTCNPLNVHSGARSWGAIEFDQELGGPNVFCTIPVQCTSCWIRFDTVHRGGHGGPVKIRIGDIFSFKTCFLDHGHSEQLHHCQSTVCW